jgi:N,N'-diacetylchitobiose transport system permease protein
MVTVDVPRTAPATAAPPEPPLRRVRTFESGPRKGKVGTVLANIAGLIFTAVMAFPAYWMINTALKPPDEVLTFTPNFVPKHITFANFVSAVKAPLFLDVLRNSLIITASAVVAALVVGFLGALAVARFRFYGRRALIMVVLLVQMVPFLALLIPLFLMLNGAQLTNTLPGVAIVYTVLILPYTVWTLRGFIANVPRELDEAALVDGCSRWQTFTRVILPLTGPGLVATSIYGFIQAWNEFIIINTLNAPENQNLMAWLLYNQTNRQTFWGPLMAGAVITSLPVVVFFLIIQRNIAMGLTAGAVKG